MPSRQVLSPSLSPSRSRCDTRADDKNKPWNSFCYVRSQCFGVVSKRVRALSAGRPSVRPSVHTPVRNPPPRAARGRAKRNETRQLRETVTQQTRAWGAFGTRLIQIPKKTRAVCSCHEASANFLSFADPAPPDSVGAGSGVLCLCCVVSVLNSAQIRKLETVTAISAPAADRVP